MAAQKVKKSQTPAQDRKQLGLFESMSFLDYDGNLTPEQRLTPRQQICVLNFNEILSVLTMMLPQYSFPGPRFLRFQDAASLSSAPRTYQGTNISVGDVVEELIINYQDQAQRKTETSAILTVQGTNKNDLDLAKRLIDNLGFTGKIKSHRSCCGKKSYILTYPLF